MQTKQNTNSFDLNLPKEKKPKTLAWFHCVLAIPWIKLIKTEFY